MQPETEQTFATLELLLGGNLLFDLSGHEDGGQISPFIWDGSNSGEFNILNLCRTNGWLKLTDADATIKDWQKMNYVRYFPDFSLDLKQTKDLPCQIESLFQVINTNLDNIESYVLNPPDSSFSFPGIILGKTKDENWICISPTVYTETNIPQEQISRSPLTNSMKPQSLSETTLTILSTIQAITSEIGTISLSGDFGGGYMYDYIYQIVYAIAANKESAIERVLQASGMLEVAQFNGFLRDRKYIEEHYYQDEINDVHQKAESINQFLNQAFPKVVMYRFSFWTDENIYIIGQTSGVDWAGICVNSQFVYNP